MNASRCTCACTLLSPESSRRSGRRRTRRTGCSPRHSLGPPAGELRILKGEFRFQYHLFLYFLFITEQAEYERLLYSIHRYRTNIPQRVFPERWGDCRKFHGSTSTKLNKVVICIRMQLVSVSSDISTQPRYRYRYPVLVSVWVASLVRMHS